jgi:hypothetical protein
MLFLLLLPNSKIPRRDRGDPEIFGLSANLHQKNGKIW